MSLIKKWNPLKVKNAKAVFRRALKLTGTILFGGLTTAIIVIVIILNDRPDLKVWHTAELDEEFNASGDVDSLAGYLELEDRLFAQLKTEVYDKIEEEDERKINRYHAGSLSDPTSWDLDWNRTWVSEPDNPKSGVLLLHGMSDSPYSMRALSERLADDETAVIALRIPGHGTAPSGLVDVEWEDMEAAVRIGINHLKDVTGGGEVSVVGYSNGGALAVVYALSAIHDESLPQIDKIVLISPLIGVTKLAFLANWQSRLGRVLGLEKLGWNAILPEYEPYKYGSFALNAARQVYCITEEIRERLEEASSEGKLDEFPQVLGFQSVVDATVSTPALLEVLYESLPDKGHELVLFDINRQTQTEPVFNPNPTPRLSEIKKDTVFDFRITVLENRDGDSQEIVSRSRLPGTLEIEEGETGLVWPEGIVSLSHVALPFPDTDPIYGGENAEPSPGIHIGSTVLRGERGVLQIPASTMLRLRWNPFYDYMEDWIVSFIRGEGESVPVSGDGDGN